MEIYFFEDVLNEMHSLVGLCTSLERFSNLLLDEVLVLAFPNEFVLYPNGLETRTGAFGESRAGFRGLSAASS